MCTFIRRRPTRPSPGTRRCSPMTKVQANTTPLALNHTGLFPSVTVSFNLATGVLAERRDAGDRQMQEKLGTPATVRGFFAGHAAGVSAVAEHGAGAGADGVAGGLYRAGDPV